MESKSSKNSSSKKPIVVGVITGLIVAVATLILQDFYGLLRSSVTTKALITFDSANETTHKDEFHKTYKLHVVNYAVPHRSSASLVIYDTARDIVHVETNPLIAPLALTDNSNVHIVHKREVFVDIVMPPPRTSVLFMVEVCSKMANSDDSTLHVMLVHEGGLYNLKMPKLKWE